MENNVLRQANNRIEVEGTLEEMNLEIKVGEEKKDGKPTGKKYNYIAGELVIRENETSTHTVEVYSKELTSEGKENNLYKGYVTIMNESLSAVEIAEKKLEAEPTKLTISGDLGSKIYYSKKVNEAVEYPKLNGKFINRVKENEEFKPRATFNTEMYIENIKPETRKVGEDFEETGRYIVKGQVPLYGNNVLTMEFVTQEGDVSDFVGSDFQVGDSVRFEGNIVDSVIISQSTTTKKTFGTVAPKTTKKFIKEFTIVGGDGEALEEEKAFDNTLIRKALAEKEIFKEEKKRQALEKEKNGGGKKTTTFGSKVQGTQPIADGDIPF